MPQKKKFNPNAEYKKAAFDPNAQYGAEQQAPADEQKPKSVWERLKEGFAGPVKVKRQVSESELATTPRFTVPGGSSTPLAQGLSEAQAISSLGATSEIGTPRSATAVSALGKSPAMLREGVAIAGRTSEGNLRPIVRAGSRLAGAAAGREIAGIEGAVVGGLSGPSIAESIIPKRTVAEQLAAPAAESVRAPYSTSEAASPVIVADVPRTAQPGVPPGSMFSTPREQLPGLIQSRVAGAPEAFQASGGRVLFRGAPEWSVGTRRPIGGVAAEAPHAPIGVNAPAARTYSARPGGNIFMRSLEPVEEGLAAPPLSAAEHAAIEQQAGVKLTDTQAQRFQRQQVEHEMVQNAIAKRGQPEETFTRAEDIAAKESQKARMKMMVTKEDEATLRDLGHSQEAIDKMKPAEAGSRLKPQIVVDPNVTKWAEIPGATPEKTIRITIPKSVAEADVDAYVKTKMPEYIKMQRKFKEGK